MSTLMSAALSLLRARLQEETANEWTDAELIAELSRAEEWFAGFLADILGSGRYVYTENITITASSETYTLSGLTKRFSSCIGIDGQLPGSSVFWEPLEELPEGKEAYLRNLGTSSSGIILPLYRVLDSTILFLPTSGSNRTVKISYKYLPTVKTAAGDTLETPDQYVDVIVARASHFSLGQEGTQNQSFEQQYAARLAEVEQREWNRTKTNRGGHVVNQTSSQTFGGLW